jgi:hypothetical protein
LQTTALLLFQKFKDHKMVKSKRLTTFVSVGVLPY